MNKTDLFLGIFEEIPGTLKRFEILYNVETLWKTLRNGSNTLWKPTLKCRRKKIFSKFAFTIHMCWMRDSSTCYNFFFQKCYFTALFSIGLFIIVQRSRDITPVKLIPMLVEKMSDICECKRQWIIVYLQEVFLPHDLRCVYTGAKVHFPKYKVRSVRDLQDMLPKTIFFFLVVTFVH